MLHCFWRSTLLLLLNITAAALLINFFVNDSNRYVKMLQKRRV